MSRLPAIETDKLSPEQRKVYDSIASGPRGGVRGPLLALLHAPELADRIQRLGEYMRYETCFPPRLSELSILLTARHHACQYEWAVHEPHALKGGLRQDVIDSIRERRDPEGLQADERLVYEFVTELLRGGRVSADAHSGIVAVFSTRGAIELSSLVGYYTLLAFILLAHEVPLPEGAQPSFGN